MAGEELGDPAVMALPLGTPHLGELLVGSNIKMYPLARCVPPLLKQPAYNPSFPVPCVQNEHSIRILGREIRKKFVPLKICAEAVEILHVSEGIVFRVAIKQAVAIGEIGKHAPRKFALVPMHAPYAICAQIMMDRGCATLVKANLKNLHRQSDSLTRDLHNRALERHSLIIR